MAMPFVTVYASDSIVTTATNTTLTGARRSSAYMPTWLSAKIVPIRAPGGTRPSRHIDGHHDKLYLAVVQETHMLVL